MTLWSLPAAPRVRYSVSGTFHYPGQSLHFSFYDALGFGGPLSLLVAAPHTCTCPSAPSLLSPTSRAIYITVLTCWPALERCLFPGPWGLPREQIVLRLCLVLSARQLGLETVASCSLSSDMLFNSLLSTCVESLCQFNSHTSKMIFQPSQLSCF